MVLLNGPKIVHVAVQRSVELSHESGIPDQLEMDHCLHKLPRPGKLLSDRRPALNFVDKFSTPEAQDDHVL